MMENQKKSDQAMFNKLNEYYTEGEQCDSDLFSEQRSNVLLVSGEHYNRRHSSFFSRLRDTKELSENQKIRLTKNHTQKIIKTYANNILAMAPGVGFMPKNESELQDQKAAELHNSVWVDGVNTYKLKEKFEEWCEQEFLTIGEVATKIFWDPAGGKLKGFKPKVGEDGQPLVAENGEFVPGEALYTGGFVFETVYGFNLLRPKEAKSMQDAEWLCIRKMVSREKLKLAFPDKQQMFQPSTDETIVVFDYARGSYRRSEKEVMVREFFFRPSQEHPKGYFYYTTAQGIFAEGELPGGIYPIVWEGCDKAATYPRAKSPIKTMRPFQAEINRAASKMAEHQITLGDDKLLIQDGTKVSQGIALPGVRSINYTGGTPTVLEGRSGAQYLEYMNSQISEMYVVMGVQEDSEIKDTSQVDPYALLFKAASKKKVHQRNIRKFERFLINVAETYIQLAKVHLPDDMAIQIVGRNERVNLEEFRNSSPLCYQIKLEPVSDDVETKLGKQLVLNHMLQYAGNNLSREDIGRLMREMPYSNLEKAFSDFTLKVDQANNAILMLDRGKIPPMHEYDDHVYMVGRLVARMGQADFDYLDPQIQQNYADAVTVHEEAEAQRQKQIQAMKDGFIPTGGYLVVCDLYVPDPKDPTKTHRARLPYQSITWLIDKLEAQGSSLDQLEQMNQGALAEISQKMFPGINPGPSSAGIGDGSKAGGAEIPQGAAYEPGTADLRSRSVY